jgi:hypothetical protein
LNLVQDRYGLETLSEMREAIWTLRNDLDSVRVVQTEHGRKLRFVARPVVWDDMRGPGTSARPSSSAPTWGNMQGEQYAWEFIAGSDRKLHFDIQMSHGMLFSRENIDIHVHWSPDNANAGTVQWRAYESWANQNEAFPADTQHNGTDNASGTAYMHQLTEVASIANRATAVSSMMKITLYRMGSLDTYGSSVWLHELDCHIPLDANGSKTDLAK